MADGEEPKYPIEVKLTGENGNAYNLVGMVVTAMRRAHVPTEEIEKFRTEAMSKDYDHLLQTCMDWVNVT